MKGTKRNAALTRLKLIDTAEQVFVDKGYDAARVDEIAALAGVNKRMIYLYYGSKEDIYTAVLRRSFERMLNASVPEEARELSALQRAEDTITRYFVFLRDNPSFVRLFAWETLNSSRGSRRALLGMGDQGLKPFREILTQGIADGVFRPDVDVNHAVVHVASLCSGYFTRRGVLESLTDDASKATAFDPEAALRQIINLVLHGIVTFQSPGAKTIG